MTLLKIKHMKIVLAFKTVSSKYLSKYPDIHVSPMLIE